MGRLALRGLDKRFGALAVLHGMDLDVAEGEFVALVGPSGCGKSTLLRLIAGLDAASGGRIELDGRLVNDLGPRERNVAMVFQSYALYPHMSVAENMGFALRLARRPRDAIGAAVGRAAGTLGLDALLDRLPKALSGGQRQRVAMGRAIVRDPSLFLFDEPLSNLDAQLRVAMRAEIKALHRRLGATTVYVTHDQIEAMTMADRVVVMRAGRIEQEGAPLDLYDRPRNAFVGGFIGSPQMNQVPGTLRLAEGRATVTLRDGQVLALGGFPAPDDLDGRPILLGLRPEHLSLGEGDGALRGALRALEPTGSETHLVLELAGGSLTAVLRGRFRADIGSSVALRPDPGHLHLFDAGTGQRIGRDERLLA